MSVTFVPIDSITADLLAAVATVAIGGAAVLFSGVAAATLAWNRLRRRPDTPVQIRAGVTGLAGFAVSTATLYAWGVVATPEVSGTGGLLLGLGALGPVFLGFGAGLALCHRDWTLSLAYAGVSAILIASPVLESAFQTLVVLFGVVFVVFGYLAEDLLFGASLPGVADPAGE